MASKRKLDKCVYTFLAPFLAQRKSSDGQDHRPLVFGLHEIQHFWQNPVIQMPVSLILFLIGSKFTIWVLNLNWMTAQITFLCKTINKVKSLSRWFQVTSQKWKSSIKCRMTDGKPVTKQHTTNDTFFYWKKKDIGTSELINFYHATKGVQCLCSVSHQQSKPSFKAPTFTDKHTETLVLSYSLVIHNVPVWLHVSSYTPQSTSRNTFQ